ncbi:MAG: ECF transporter S component [Clostridia bacterium]|nr:ECF transporter S component [Clostridia bacterium]
MRKTPIQSVALGGMLAALVWLFTFTVQIPIPATAGYVNGGDGIILLAGALLGPFAWLPAGIGAALADLLSGYSIYVVPTFLIKGLMGFVAGRFARRGRMLSNVCVFVAVEAMMVGGYLIFEGFALGWAAAFAGLGMNAAQGVAGVAIGGALCTAFQNTSRQM